MTARRNTSKDALRLDVILAAAQEQTGLTDFGDTRFLEPCQRWLDSVIAEAPLSETGTVSLHHSIVAPIATRLRIHDFVTRHPQILDEDVADPVVVVGLTRTGTTKLQRALSSDPEVQSLPFWRVLNPVPLPGEGPGESHHRMAMAEGMCTQMRESSPEFYSAHAIMPTEPEEETFAIEFDTRISVGRVPTRSYVDWWLARPRSERAHMYDYLRTFMQCVQWQDAGRVAGGTRRPFVLKSPQHVGELRCLAAAFPRATVVNTHRDIDSTVASSASAHYLLAQMYSDHVDPHLMGELMLKTQAEDTAQNLADRQILGDTVQIIDVDYEEVRNNCIGVVREIWDRRGRALTASEEAQITNWDGHHPQHSFGRHTYSLEQFGLSSVQVAKAFAPYLDAFPQHESLRHQARR